MKTSRADSNASFYDLYDDSLHRNSTASTSSTESRLDSAVSIKDSPVFGKTIPLFPTDYTASPASSTYSDTSTLFTSEDSYIPHRWTTLDKIPEETPSPPLRQRCSSPHSPVYKNKRISRALPPRPQERNSSRPLPPRPHCESLIESYSSSDDSTLYASEEISIPRIWNTLNKIPEVIALSPESSKKSRPLPPSPHKPRPLPARPQDNESMIESCAESYAFSIFSDESSIPRIPEEKLNVDEEYSETMSIASTCTNVQSIRSSRKSPQKLEMYIVNNTPNITPLELVGLSSPESDEVYGEGRISAKSSGSCKSPYEPPTPLSGSEEVKKKKVHWGGIDFGRLEYVEESSTRKWMGRVGLSFYQ